MSGAIYRVRGIFMGSNEKNLRLLNLAWPIFIQQLLSMFLGYADTIMMSHYSDIAVGALGNANQITGFLILAFSVITSATGVVVSQYLGAGKTEEMNKIYSVALMFNFFISIFVSLLISVFASPLLRFIKIPNVMMKDAVQYMQVTGCFLFSNALIQVFAEIFNCNGKTLYGMIIMFAMNILNIAGNYIFLYGPLAYLNMGTVGVGISTSASRLICLVACIVIFKKQIGGKFSFSYFKPFPKELLAKLVKIGVPAAGEGFSYNVSLIIISVFVNTLGPIAITARVYCNILCGFSTIFSNSIASATAIITGHAVGAGREDYAYKKVLNSLLWAVIITAGISFTNFAISRWTLSLFTKNAEIIELGHRVMFVAFCLELGRVVNYVVIRSMRAAGDIVFPVVLGICSMWIISIGLAWLLGIHFKLGLVGIWCGMAADEIFRGVVVFIRWIMGSWRGRKIVAEK